MSVREELEKLGRLQEIDLKIDRARRFKTSAPQAFSQLEMELRRETDNLQVCEAARAEFEKQKRQVETEILMDQDRIKNIENRLAGVTNNKEFHAATKESEKAKKLIGDRTKSVAELAEKIKAQETLSLEIQAKIEALRSTLDQKKNEVGSQLGEADKEIESYAGDRNAIVAQIQPPLMSRYNRIRSVYSDAIVAVRAGHCSSCNVALPPQLYILVQKGSEVVTCPSCQRLLYHKVQ